MPNRFLIVCGGSGVNLLGQRRVLGINGELQIDVSGEIRPSRGDQHRLSVALDQRVGAVGKLLQETNLRVDATPSEVQSVYLQPSITKPADKQHLAFLTRKWQLSGDLAKGLAQAPVIGGATIRHPENVRELKTQLSRMVTEFAVNPGKANPLEVWIVASTAGGTGEGTHRYVAAAFAEACRTRYNAPVVIHFVRIGALTYRSVNMSKTAINTFMGVAADAALGHIFNDEFKDLTVNWYYLDLPDVKTDESAKRVRAEMIEMAAKSVMLEELSEQLGLLLVNNNGSKMVPIRTGFWGKDFDENVKYYETLKQLVQKLNVLINPNYARAYIDNQPAPQFADAGWENEIRADLEREGALFAKLEEENWEFPEYRRNLQQLADMNQLREQLRIWKTEIGKLIGREIDDLPVPLTLSKTVREDGQEKTRDVPLNVPNEIGPDEDWFATIDNVHQAKAWAGELLGLTGGKITKGLLKELDTLARECSRVQHPPIYERFTTSTEKKAKELSKRLWRFIEILVRVNKLVNLEDAATRLLARELSRPKDVLKQAITERDIAKAIVAGLPESPVNAAELSDILDRLEGVSWLRLLEKAIQQRDRDLFRQTVLRGATGLTAAGLRSVLGLNPTADVTEMRKELRERMGRMYSRDTVERREFEAQYWQATPPSGVTKRYNFRILPVLDATLAAQLKSSLHAGEDGFDYVFTKLGLIGLNVLAFEGVSLNADPGPDYVTTPAYLLKPLLPIVKEQLAKWDEDAQGRSGKFEIACAGVIGEPLYKPALKEAGLTDEELTKLEELYEMYEYEKGIPN